MIIFGKKIIRKTKTRVRSDSGNMSGGPVPVLRCVRGIWHAAVKSRRLNEVFI